MDYLTVNQTASLLHVSPQRVRQLLTAGKLKGVKFSKIWMISPLELRCYLFEKGEKKNGR